MLRQQNNAIMLSLLDRLYAIPVPHNSNQKIYVVMPSLFTYFLIFASLYSYTIDYLTGITIISCVSLYLQMNDWNYFNILLSLFDNTIPLKQFDNTITYIATRELIQHPNKYVTRKLPNENKHDVFSKTLLPIKKTPYCIYLENNKYESFVFVHGDKKVRVKSPCEYY